MLRRLVSYSNSLSALSVEIEPSEDPDHLYHLCYELISKTPDAGNTPQKIVAFLLKCYHIFFHTGIKVTGGEDRASVTSTTSKKPGDINEERAGQIYKVYEVTVKHCYAYQNIIYYYWDIYEWIANALQRMNPYGRKAFYIMLNEYINETNTSEAVKKIWQQLHIDK